MCFCRVSFKKDTFLISVRSTWINKEIKEKINNILHCAQVMQSLFSTWRALETAAFKEQSFIDFSEVLNQSFVFFSSHSFAKITFALSSSVSEILIYSCHVFVKKKRFQEKSE